MAHQQRPPIGQGWVMSRYLVPLPTDQSARRAPTRWIAPFREPPQSHCSRARAMNLGRSSKAFVARQAEKGGSPRCRAPARGQRKGQTDPRSTPQSRAAPGFGATLILNKNIGTKSGKLRILGTNNMTVVLP